MKRAMKEINHSLGARFDSWFAGVVESTEGLFLPSLTFDAEDLRIYGEIASIYFGAQPENVPVVYPFC